MRHTAAIAAAPRRTPVYEFDVSTSSAVPVDSEAAGSAERDRARRSKGPLSAELLGSDAALLAGGELPDDRPDLPAGQPAAARAAAPRARQAAAAGSLGHVAGAEPGLRPPEPADHRARRRRHLPGRSRPRRTGHRRQRLPGGDLLRDLPGDRRRTPTACAGSSASSRRRAASPATSACTTPGSIHEGGELGYVLTHAFGAAFDNPDLIVAAVVGDGEAETGPLAGSWKGDQLPQPGPRRGGAADPAPQRLQDRQPDRARAVLRRRGRRLPATGTATRPISSRATTRPPIHQAFAAALDACYERIRAIQQEAREHGVRRSTALAGHRPAHPEGLDRTGGGRRQAGGGHLPVAPGAAGPSPHRARSSWPSSRTWLRSYEPERLFDERGRLRAGAGRPGAAGRPADGREPARQRRPADQRPGPAGLPRLRPGARRTTARRVTRTPGRWAGCCATSSFATPSQANFRLFCPDELTSNRLGDVLEVENRCFVGPTAGDRRPPLARTAG